MATSCLDLRIDEDIKAKAEKAAALLDFKSLTEYVIKIIDENAAKVIAEYESVISEIDQAAVDLFEGDVKEARAWMFKPACALDDRRPIDCLLTITEARTVLTLLRRLDLGVGV